MLKKLKRIVLTEEQIDREIYKIQNLIKIYEKVDKKTNKEQVLMYLNGKLDTLNWIKEVEDIWKH